VSVFAGNDPARWQRDVASYADVDLGAVWPGISVALTAQGKQVEKVFTVAPGAVPDAIRVRVAGAESLAAAADGGLLVHTGVGDVRLTPPVAYQEVAGTRRMLPAQYAISGDEYGFRVRDYDPTVPVVIDPLLQATFLGGSEVDQAFALAIEPTTGDVYVAGLTQSIDFPARAPAHSAFTPAAVATRSSRGSTRASPSSSRRRTWGAAVTSELKRSRSCRRRATSTSPAPRIPEISRARAAEPRAPLPCR